MKTLFSVMALMLVGSLLWWKWPHIQTYVHKSLTPTTTTGTGVTTQYQKAYFAAGCFWCAESGFEKYPGVIDAVSGYAGGKEPSPTYEQVA